MLVAFEKRKIAELPFNAIPKIDDIVFIVKKT
jgi:sporulation protein YlmC with PRC-barrel domain